MSKMSKALILAPHTDDGELGLGGSMNKLVEEGCRVYYVAFSICEESVPAGYEPEALLNELYEATSILGLKRNDVFALRHRVRRFSEARQEILEQLVKLKDEIKPDWVFMPSSRSIHQDHQVVYAEGMRAFNYHTCLGYELPWDVREFSTTAYQILSEHHIQAKVAALQMYKTQDRRKYMDPTFILSLAKVRGVQVRQTWAEAFEVLRIIL